MSHINAARFDGSLSELYIYHLAIFDTSCYVKLFHQNAKAIREELMIRDFETEAACSWCVTEAVKRGFPEITVLNHELNDRYEAIYDVYFLGEEHDFRRKLLPYLNFHAKVKTFKVMPMLDKTLVAIGT